MKAIGCIIFAIICLSGIVLFSMPDGLLQKIDNVNIKFYLLICIVLLCVCLGYYSYWFIVSTSMRWVILGIIRTVSFVGLATFAASSLGLSQIKDLQLSSAGFFLQMQPADGNSYILVIFSLAILCLLSFVYILACIVNGREDKVIELLQRRI